MADRLGGRLCHVPIEPPSGGSCAGRGSTRCTPGGICPQERHDHHHPRRVDLVTEAVNEGLRAHRERRATYAADPAQLLEVLRAGNSAADAVAETTLAEVRQGMSMDY